MSPGRRTTQRKSPKHVPGRGGSGMTMHFRKAAPKNHFSTLLSTLNCIKAWNLGQESAQTGRGADRGMPD
jgi:hypothetical protein